MHTNFLKSRFTRNSFISCKSYSTYRRQQATALQDLRYFSAIVSSAGFTVNQINSPKQKAPDWVL